MMRLKQESPSAGGHFHLQTSSQATTDGIGDLDSSEISELLDLVVSGSGNALVTPISSKVNYSSSRWLPDATEQPRVRVLPRILSPAQFLSGVNADVSNASARGLSPRFPFTRTLSPILNPAMFPSETWTRNGNTFLRPQEAFPIEELQTPRQLVSPLALLGSAAAKATQEVTWKTPKANKCPFPGCVRLNQGRGGCLRHGGGRRCSVDGCPNASQATGKCKRHGGGSRCSVQDCNRSSQSSGLCRTHGGGKLCVHPGCKKGIQRNGKCSTHGGCRKCSVNGCSRVDRGGGLCGKHQKTHLEYFHELCADS